MRPGRALDVARDLPGDELNQPLVQAPTNQFPELVFLGLVETPGKSGFPVGNRVGPASELIGGERAGDGRWRRSSRNWLAVGPLAGRRKTMAGHVASKKREAHTSQGGSTAAYGLGICARELIVVDEGRKRDHWEGEGECLQHGENWARSSMRRAK